MHFAEGDKTAANETLLRAASAAYPCEDDPHPIDLPHSSRLYKTLLQGGHFNRATSGVEQVPTIETLSLSRSSLWRLSERRCAWQCASRGS
ncbi:hypothetical protein K438DRAFT_1796570 [Mycena galopus ATCC 62051]|nr:hypothetical protein K438DRAFT_1796570 [Mycena galopus ATCC 62051]